MSQTAAPTSAVWLVRARGGENAPYAIENNCAVCSFREFPDLSECADLLAIKERLRPGWSHLSNRQFGQRAGQCYQFALEIDIDDLIFIPISPERKAAIGKVVGRIAIAATRRKCAAISGRWNGKSSIFLTTVFPTRFAACSNRGEL